MTELTDPPGAAAAAFWRMRMSAPTPVPVPEPGWQVGPPSFVGIGAQKSGTSLWYELICTHPQIRPVAHKEVHFFDRLLADEDPDVSGYQRHFPRAPGELCGEWTPRYMVDPWTPPLLAAAAPDAKILVLLRDPVERFAAGLDWERHLAIEQGWPVTSASAADALQRGLYGSQIEHVLRSFDREQLLVLQYERCVAEPRRWLAATFEHLGVDSVPAARIETLPIVNGNPARRPLSRHLRTSLRAYYEADVSGLAAAFPELDLAWWPSFATA